ncbi:putative Acyltransferase 3 [Bradyrhizobium sp. ORS 285]|uniref:acyltransferase family protein n=1 Tax=Bradyrhizobium sp. ORS 285 TaxID=115808 RepID=UPI0002408517|nr:acyltransferase family protein [Bradyrhizobium sp. ORS 285]CCD90337.1 putative Acyltransferase 3 [Bradyrhizobium sp. ORS 285]SMX57820.1 putative Acyltransferase 3 [Bradyrhizobium sp. ORS 285]
MSSINYRPDIDCLRAFAVISVIAFHYDIPPFRSGYVGVDVFFVISGFLITRIIRDEARAGTFSFAAFYRRRARRILPAAFAMLFAILLGAGVILLPQDTVSAAQQALAVLTFSSNILFWSQQGYFDAAGITKPLLHTWSLGVEEQYYLLFPVFALAVFRLRRPLMLASLIAVCAASLLLCVIQTRTHPAAAFYLLPARAWQLALGALLAVEALPALRSQSLRIAVTTLGWIALGISVNIYSPRTPYPGVAALLPCLATAAVIWGKPDLNRTVLTVASPMIAIGLWSYSLYLWHWPVASFATAMWGPPSSATDKLALLGACTMLALASFYLVEQPARRADWQITARALAATGATAVAASITMIMLSGFPGRFSPQQQAMAAFLGYDHRSAYEEGHCFLTPGQTFAALQPDCLAKGARPRVLLWGDSHAAHLVDGLKRALPQITLARATMAQCVPYDEPGQSSACAEFNRRLPGLVRDLAPDIVILSGNWTRTAMAPAARASLQAVIKTIADTGAEIVVVGPSPQFDRPLPHLLIAAQRFGVATDGHTLDLLGEVDEFLRELLDGLPQTDYVSLIDRLCPRSRCVLQTSDDAPLAWDDGHFTAQGSALAAIEIVKASPALAASITPRSE